MKTYLIEYRYTGTTEKLSMRVKNCTGEIHAVSKLCEYIKRKKGKDIEVISCKNNTDILDWMNDIFGVTFDK